MNSDDSFDLADEAPISPIIKDRDGNIVNEVKATTNELNRQSEEFEQEHPAPYSKTPPNPKDNNPAQLTPAHQQLLMLVNTIPGTKFIDEDPFPRENPVDADEYTNELTRDGHQKSYQSDLYDFQLRLALEAQGSSHDELEDASKRDAYFKEQNIEVLKFANRDIERSPHLVKQIVELKVENIRLRKQFPEVSA